MQLKSLKPNKRNPRKISDKGLEALHKSLDKFGDLSGIVRNIRTENLISGHQRQKSLPADATIKIERKYDVPTRCHTVAEGFVMVDGERFTYREVDADEQWETEALLAANNQGGENDADLIKLVIADFPNMDPELAGIYIPAPVVPDLSPTFSGSDEQQDAAYARDTEQTSEQIETGNGVPSGGSAFAETDEQNKEAPNRRIVIIIDCPTQVVKEALRDKIKSEVEQHGAKFF